MKVLIINQHKDDVLGGSEIQCDLIAKYLTKFGHEVIYGAVKGKNDRYNTDYRVIKTSRSSSSIIELCKEVKPDIIYWRFNKHVFYKSAKAINQQKIPIVFGVSHINDVTRFAFKPKKSKNLIYQFLERSYQQLISAYNFKGYRYIQGLTSLNEDYMNKIKVENQLLLRNSMESQVVEFEWKRPYCVWIANIKPAKNPEEFIHLASQYKNKQVDFLMVGKIQNSNYKYIEQGKDLPSNFHYLGAKSPEEVNGILKNSLFMVHTCSPEGFGNNFIQAWKQAKPTISLYFDPNGFITSEGIGFYSKNREQMKVDADKLLKSQKLREDMGKRAYNFANDTFNPEINIKRLEQFLGGIIEKYKFNV